MSTMSKISLAVFNFLTANHMNIDKQSGSI